LILIGILLIFLQKGFGQCVACQSISESIETYEEIEELIEVWICIGYEAIIDDNGETVQIAIMELQTQNNNLLYLTVEIENFTNAHTCNLPPEELPEYIEPTPPADPAENPWDPYPYLA
jgi:hypothetical protein